MVKDRPFGSIQRAAKQLNLGQPRTNPGSFRMKGHQITDQHLNHSATLFPSLRKYFHNQDKLFEAFPTQFEDFCLVLPYFN